MLERNGLNFEVRSVGRIERRNGTGVTQFISKDTEEPDPALKLVPWLISFGVTDRNVILRSLNFFLVHGTERIQF